MKVKISLTRQEMQMAVASYVTDILGLHCEPNDVTTGYSWEQPVVEIDTDEQNELASIAAQQQLDDELAVKEAA